MRFFRDPLAISVGGVKVGAYPGTLVFYALVVLAASVVMPQLSLGSHLLVGFGIIFSIFAHEVGHWAAGIRNNVPITAVFLTINGGATHHGHIGTRRAMLEMAAAGLIVNLALAGLFWGLSHFGPNTLSPAFGFLANSNLLLVGFNVLPLLPMDGGLLAALALSRRSDFETGWARLRLFHRFFALTALLLGFLASPKVLLLAFVLVVLLRLSKETPDPEFNPT